MMHKLLSLYGLKFHPFRPGLPVEALFPLPDIDRFCRRIELTLADGGFAMITGEPGTGKSATLRLLASRLEQQRDVVVGTIDHPQSGVSDFYRELGELFGVPLTPRNRWGGFKALRQCWSDHIASTLMRPVLLVDEAQDMQAAVFNEIKTLSSQSFDSQQLLCVIFAGDGRLLDRLRAPELLPLNSRIRRRLTLGYTERDALTACLDHVLDEAGNPALMTTELKTTLAEHAAGTLRTMMDHAEDLLFHAADNDIEQLDEKLFFDVFHPPAKPSSKAKTRGARTRSRK